MAEKVTPGRALSPEQYSGGFVDFYKDYLGTTGIESSVPIDEEEEEEKQYIAPNIIGDGGDSDTPTSILSINALGESNKLGSNIEHMSIADMQSMDLSSKTWNDYRAGKGLTDKVNLKAEAGYQGLAAMLGGTAGSMVYGALGGTGEKTPWGVENSGAGGFRVVSNAVNSMKYDALKEMQAVRSAYESFEGGADAMMDFGDPTEFKPDLVNGDYNMGYKMTVNGQHLVRPVGKTQYIGTLPMGVTNQQILNQEAVNSGKLPNRVGFGTDDGFGITNEGGYNSAGRYVDQYGNIAQVGLDRHFDALADKDFFGNKDLARDWLDAVRKESGFFSSGMSITDAQALKNRINSNNPNNPDNDDKKSKTKTDFDYGGGFGNFITPNNYGTELDGIYTGPGSSVYDRAITEELDSVYTGPGSLAYDRAITEELDGVYTGGSPSVKSSPTAPVDRTYFGNAGVDLAAGGPRGIEFSRSRLGGINQGTNRFTTAIQGQRAGKSLFADTRTQTPTSIFNDMISRGFTPREATEVLNTIVPQTKPVESFMSGVVPASYTPSSSDDNNNDTTTATQEQVQAEADMGLDPFGGAGEPVDTSGGGGGGGGDKIVCTAMNNAYGFGSFRQTIWLKHSKNLDPAYQLGYHKLFKPLVKYAYVSDSLPNRIIKKWLEGVAKRRTADIWLQSRNKKRPIFGRLERFILEPICYIAGKI